MRSRVNRCTDPNRCNGMPALQSENIVGVRRQPRQGSQYVRYSRFPSRRSSAARRLARLIHGLAPQQIPAVPSDPWRDSTRHKSAQAKRRSAPSTPPVGGLGGSHQGSAQFSQFGSSGTFVKRGGDILRRASHLVDTVGQVSGLVGRQHHRVGWQRRAFHTVDRGPLLVGTLPTRLPAVLAATAQPVVGDVSSTPAARLRADATSHGPDFSRGACRIPV
ncbi:MAG: hypothetical protein QOI30_709 [Mycobacterium sp.]|nr:hypothetical protein [Mycobacterium sp.]